MMTAANRGVGDAIATPDVCLTPAASGADPIPYTNDAMNAQATGCSETVKVSMMNAMTLLTSVASSNGDEAGTSSANRGKASFTSGDPAVYIDGVPAVRLTSTTTQNGANAVGSVTVPSVTTVLFSEGPLPPREGTISGLIGGVAVVPLSRFDDATVGALRAARHSTPGPWLIDLRGNPGGALDAALDAAALFLPAGACLTVLDTTVGAERRRVGVTGPLTAPLFLLTDGLTASAAELFAATLQHHQRAIVVGAATYGKSRVDRHDAAGASAPEARWRLPDGRPFTRVAPDLSLDPNDAQAVAHALAALAAMLCEGSNP